MKISIVIPTYNEKNNIKPLVEKIFNLDIKNLNLIIVDDNSPDKTGKIIDQLAKKYHITPIHRRKKKGLGSAYIAGFKQALKKSADIIFEMDADFSHNPGDIPRFINAANQGYDVIIGSRRIKGGDISGWNSIRNLQSKAAATFARTLLNLKTHDITAGFRCYRKKVLQHINLDSIKSNGYAFQEEMIYLCEKKRFKIKEIPVAFIDRSQGKSKLGPKDIIEFFTTICRLKFKKIHE